MSYISLQTECGDLVSCVHIMVGDVVRARGREGIERLLECQVMDGGTGRPGPGTRSTGEILCAFQLNSSILVCRS